MCELTLMTTALAGGTNLTVTDFTLSEARAHQDMASLPVAKVPARACEYVQGWQNTSSHHQESGNAKAHPTQ